MCMWYYGCYPFWARRWITLLDSNNRNGSCSVWEMKRLPWMRVELSVRGCALLLTGACGGWAGEVRASWLDCFSAIGGSEIWCSKKKKKKKPNLTSSSSNGRLRSEYGPCAYARGYALLCSTVIQPLLLVFFWTTQWKDREVRCS